MSVLLISEMGLLIGVCGACVGVWVGCGWGCVRACVQKGVFVLDAFEWFVEFGGYGCE